MRSLVSVKAMMRFSRAVERRGNRRDSSRGQQEGSGSAGEKIEQEVKLREDRKDSKSDV